jgi:hypothetical protein
MRKQVWILLIVGVFALGLLAAGCGGNDDTGTTEVTLEDTDATTTTTGGETTITTDTSTTTTDTTSTSGDTSPDDVYNACVDAIKGTAAESAGETACAQARDAFEQCAKQAEAAGGDAADTALGICQQAADQAVKSLEAAGG